MRPSGALLDNDGGAGRAGTFGVPLRVHRHEDRPDDAEHPSRFARPSRYRTLKAPFLTSAERLGRGDKAQATRLGTRLDVRLLFRTAPTSGRLPVEPNGYR